MVLGPIIISAVLFGFTLVQVRVLKQDARKWYARYAFVQLVVLFLVLPACSTTVFRAFLCDDEFGAPGVSFLEADYSLSCASHEYRSLRKLAVFGIIAYPCFVNLLYGGLLWNFRESIRNDTREARPLSFLFKHYSPKYFAFEVVDSIRRIALTGMLVFVPERSRAAVGTMLALSFWALHENTKPYKETPCNVLASIANA